MKKERIPNITNTNRGIYSCNLIVSHHELEIATTINVYWFQKKKKKKIKQKFILLLCQPLLPSQAH